MKTRTIEGRYVHRTEINTVRRRVRASFSPDILQAGAVKGLIKNQLINHRRNK